MPYVYILKCADGSYYTGSTTHLEYRVDQHMAGSADAYTSTRLPVQLVFFQEFSNVGEAFEAEMKIKGWSRRKKEALISGEYESLRVLSKRRGGRPLPRRGFR